MSTQGVFNMNTPLALGYRYKLKLLNVSSNPLIIFAI